MRTAKQVLRRFWFRFVIAFRWAWDRVPRTGKQVLREFSIPFVIALLWAWYRVPFSQSGWLSSAIANFTAAFFFASWAVGHIMRIRRQHTTEDFFQGIENRLTQLATTTTAIMGKVVEVQELRGNAAAVEPLIQDLSTLTMTANTQVAEANNAIADARNRENIASLGWFSDWSLPQRLVPNPAIYGTSTAETPLALRESTMRFSVGETYEGDFPGGARRAVVVETMDDGRKGKLRFTDNGEELPVLWVELHQAGKWHRIASP